MTITLQTQAQDLKFMVYDHIDWNEGESDF